MQWNVAQVIAANIKGGNNALPLIMKCFHVNENEHYGGLFPSQSTGDQPLEDSFHDAINTAGCSLFWSKGPRNVNVDPSFNRVSVAKAMCSLPVK